MRILLVGADSPYAIERPYMHYLSRSKEVTDIRFFRAQNQFLDYYNSGLFHKILYRAGLSKILDQINVSLNQAISEMVPDVVFVFKGMEIFSGTLKWAKARGIKLVNYNPDNPFVFSGRGS